MRHLRLVASVVVLICGLLVIPCGAVLGQDSTPATGAHPLVGTWSITDEGTPDDVPSLTIIGADGSFIDVDLTQDEGGQPSGQDVGVGVWQPTGAQTAKVTVWYRDTEGTGIIRADIEVAGDGQTFTASYTVQFTSLDGSFDTGEIGPFQASGVRMTVEPQGTPVASSFEEVFGTPEATPAG